MLDIYSVAAAIPRDLYIVPAVRSNEESGGVLGAGGESDVVGDHAPSTPLLLHPPEDVPVSRQPLRGHDVIRSVCS